MARRRSPTASSVPTAPCSTPPKSKPSARRSTRPSRSRRSPSLAPGVSVSGLTSHGKHLMENIGSLAILLAFCFAVYAVTASLAGKWARRPFLVLSAERAVYSIWVLLSVAAGLLIYSLIHGDYRLAYVVMHSNQSMPTVYKFAAWWGGQEGSLLFWSWLLASYASVVVFRNRRKFREMMPYVTAVLMATQTFFLILIAFVAEPFEVLMQGKGNIV